MSGVFESAAGGESFAELHEPLLDQCLERIGSMADKFKVRSEEEAEEAEKPRRRPKCSWTVQLVYSCMWQRYVRQCPAAAWNGCECGCLGIMFGDCDDLWIVLQRTAAASGART